MSKALELDPDEVLSKIHVGRAYNSHQQMLMVEKVSELAKERPIRMLAVDSLTGAFRAEYIGRMEIKECIVSKGWLCWEKIKVESRF